MIQRIQSIYLLLAVLFCLTLMFLPIAEYTLNAEIYIFSVFGVEKVSEPFQPPIVNTMPVLMILIAAILTAFITIFLFKNRKLQLRLCGLTMLLLTALLASMFFYADKVENIIGGDIVTSFKFGALAPIIAMILVFLAIKGIKKDEELVRSADRIR